MRLGQEDEARAELRAVLTRTDYRDAATVNTLRLLDSYKNFVTFKTDSTILRLHKKEAELLRPYFEAELERALATYEKKYEFKLDRPVQVEVYPDHEDFAVRTMGMPGLGALGVTFGYVVAMDSPSGRPARHLPLGQHPVARDEPRLRAGHDQASACRAGSPKAWRCTKRPRSRRSGATAWTRTSSRPSRTRSCCRWRNWTAASSVPAYPDAGDRVVFPGGPHLRLHRRRSGAGRSCSP